MFFPHFKIESICIEIFQTKGNWKGSLFQIEIPHTY